MYSSISCCTSQWPSQWGWANFDPPPTAPKPLSQFWWNLNLKTTIQRPPTMQKFILIPGRGWSRRMLSLPLLGFFLRLSFFLVTSSRTQVAPVDQYWRSICHMTSFCPMMCLSVVSLICLPMYVCMYICVNMPMCVTVPNFAVIGQTFAEIWWFSIGRPTECRYCRYPAPKGRCHGNHFLVFDWL